MLGSINSETLVRSDEPLGVIGFLMHPRGIHGSAQILVLLPLPIRQIRPCFRSQSPYKILRHEYEMPSLAVHCKIVVFGKYFAFRTWPHRVSGLVKSRHACRASIAILNKCRSRKPRPPSSLISSISPSLTSVSCSLCLVGSTNTDQ